MTNWIGRGSDEWSLEEGMGAAADIGRFSADLISHSVQELSITYKMRMFCGLSKIIIWSQPEFGDFIPLLFSFSELQTMM